MADIGRAALILTSQPGPMVRAIGKAAKKVKTQLQNMGANVQPRGIQKFMGKVRRFMQSGIGQAMRGAVGGAFAGFATGGLTGGIAGALGGIALMGGPIGAVAAAAAGATLMIGRMINRLKELGAQEAQEIDRQAELARRLGITTDQLQGLERVASLNGVALGTVERMVQQMNIRLGAATRNVNPMIGALTAVGQTAGALRQLGLDAIALQRMNPAEAVLEIGEALNAVDNVARRADLQARIFGARAGPQAELMIQNLGQVRAEIENLRRRGLLFGPGEAEGVETMNDALMTFKENFQGFIRRMTVAFAPIITAWTNFWDSIWTNAQPIVRIMSRAFMTLMQPLIDHLRLVTMWIEKMAPLWDAIEEAVNAFGQAFSEAFDNDLVGALFDNQARGAERFAAAAATWIRDIIPAMRRAAQWIATTAKTVVNLLFNTARAFLSVMSRVVTTVSIVAAPFIFVGTLIGKLVELILPAVRSIVGFTANLARSVADFFMSIIRNIVNFMRNVVPLFRPLVNLLANLIPDFGGGGFFAAFQEAIAGMQNTLNEMQAAFNRPSRPAEERRRREAEEPNFGKEAERILGLIGRGGGSERMPGLANALAEGSTAAVSAINRARLAEQGAGQNVQQNILQAARAALAREDEAQRTRTEQLRVLTEALRTGRLGNMAVGANPPPQAVQNAAAANAVTQPVEFERRVQNAVAAAAPPPQPPGNIPQPQPQPQPAAPRINVPPPAQQPATRINIPRVQAPAPPPPAVAAAQPRPPQPNQPGPNQPGQNADVVAELRSGQITRQRILRALERLANRQPPAPANI